jgi:alkylated DNA nucleotide flippase Atl1
MDQQDTAAFADFFRQVGGAFTDLADTLQPIAQEKPERQADLDSLGLGARQREIADALLAAGDAGMRAAEIAAAIKYDPANTHTALRALGTRGVAEEVRADPEEAPRWRLMPEYRGTSDPYLRIAGLIRSGEWSTYGDISIAARGDTKAARAVGRAAANLEAFPSPHRVLWSGGRIPPTWKSHESPTPDPEECERRLRAEGVSFNDKGHASRQHFVSWDVLVQRSEREG